MGSESDMPVMREAAKALQELQIPHELHIISAHRTPRRAAEFAEGAAQRGIKVIIAAAGGAAHLAGAIAARTVLPVIGVPIKTQELEGLDSLLSTLQMPKGVPVATVAINGARNAAILAAQMLALGDPKLAEGLRNMRRRMEQETEQKSKELNPLEE
jgi:phosphoribosylaminoimidazole carboxylase PurE protein